MARPTRGTCDGACNLISGNDAEGIFLPVFRQPRTTISFKATLSGPTAVGRLTAGIRLKGICVTRRHGQHTGRHGCGRGQSRFRATPMTASFSLSAFASGNVVQGNIIGLDKNGTTDLGNSQDGIDIRNGASNTVIGGTTASAAQPYFGQRFGGDSDSDHHHHRHHRSRQLYRYGHYRHAGPRATPFQAFT